MLCMFIHLIPTHPKNYAARCSSTPVSSLSPVSLVLRFFPSSFSFFFSRSESNPTRSNALCASICADGRECRQPFTCTNRVDEAGIACKCPRAVGRNNCAVCDFSTTGAVCLRCTNRQHLRAGVCVEACREGEQSVGDGVDGRECT